MARFPMLRTGAVAQYGSGRATGFATQVHRFLDGSEQSCRIRGAGRRRWLIAANLLDEGELRRLEQFFVDQRGAEGRFEFVDPETGDVIPECSFEGDEMRFNMTGQQRGSLRIVVRENLS